MRTTLLIAAATAALIAAPATAQGTTQQPDDRLERILGALFGTGTAADTSLEAQWRAGRTPLAAQRAAFDARVDADVRAGALTPATGTRLKSDYAAVVDLERRLGADGVYTTAERDQLIDRYGELTQALSERGYNEPADDFGGPVRAEVADGRTAFYAQVDTAVAQRRLTRLAGTRLKTDYAALVTLESSYLRDGRLTATEREDLAERLDALDARLEAGAVVTPRARLDAIARALPTSGLTAAQQNQLRVEHGDLVRLEAAYARLTPTADERAYLERRLVNLETRARVRR